MSRGDFATKALTFEPEPDMVVSLSLGSLGCYLAVVCCESELPSLQGHFKNGDRERKIYCNIELSEEDMTWKLDARAVTCWLDSQDSSHHPKTRFVR